MILFGKSLGGFLQTSMCCLSGRMEEQQVGQNDNGSSDRTTHAGRIWLQQVKKSCAFTIETGFPSNSTRVILFFSLVTFCFVDDSQHMIWFGGGVLSVANNPQNKIS